MRSGGFPCRVVPCERSFQVADQTSMASLAAASRARSEHEVQVHGYHHVRLDEGVPRAWGQRVAKKPGA